MKLMCIGDIVGRAGRRALRLLLPQAVDRYQPDFIVANAENAAGGFGITKGVAEEILGYGVDLLTMGNHCWDNKDIYKFIEGEERLIRPANFPEPAPGRGFRSFNVRGKRVLLINLLGRIFLSPVECPFRYLDQLLAEDEGADYIIVDFHAEATSEKKALGYYADGRASLLFGTHTHVQTSDQEILPAGTGYITDLGMTGAIDSVLGVKKEEVIKRLKTQRPYSFKVGTGAVQLQGIAAELDNNTKRALSIERFDIKE